MTNSILHNIPAIFTADSISRSMDNLKTSAVRLSSGKQIVQASDDPAGAAIGSGLETDKSTAKAALNTTAQANSILAIADGGMSNLSDIVTRLISLSSQANSGALGTTELGYIQAEMNSLISQIGTVVTTTTFNGTALLDGNYTNKNFQVGLASSDVISVSFSALDANTLGIGNLDIVNNVSGAVTSLNSAIDTIKTTRATLGAAQSRFNFAASNIESSINNLTAAASVYLDADFTKISTEFANEQTQLQAGIATLAQVNNLSANLLKLIS